MITSSCGPDHYSLHHDQNKTMEICEKTLLLQCRAVLQYACHSNVYLITHKSSSKIIPVSVKFLNIIFLHVRVSAAPSCQAAASSVRGLLWTLIRN